MKIQNLKTFDQQFFDIVKCADEKPTVFHFKGNYLASSRSSNSVGLNSQNEKKEQSKDLLYC